MHTYIFSIGLIKGENIIQYSGIVQAERYSLACIEAWKAIYTRVSELGGGYAQTEFIVDQVIEHDFISLV